MIKKTIRLMNHDLHRNLGKLEFWEIKELILNFILRNPKAYNNYLKRKYGGPVDFPNGYDESNKILLSDPEVKKANDEVDRLKIPHIVSKDWDTLIALSKILETVPKNGKILDAGAEHTSVMLPWLHMYGYEHLFGINLTFYRNVKKGNILYEFGDATKTRYADNYFDFVTCLSVIEHGVPQEKFLSEMARIIKDKGYLFVSTDFRDSNETHNGTIEYWNGEKLKYEDVPWTIFNRSEIEKFISLASKYGFKQTSQLNFESHENPINFSGEKYTYISLCFQKSN